MHYKYIIKEKKENVYMNICNVTGLAGKASFTVFMTDYDTYAGVYTCQKLPASNRRSATILSRKKSLDKQVVDKVR